MKLKLERLPEYITVILATLVGCSLAVICGQWVGGAQFIRIGMIVGGVIAILVALMMRSSIWLLIPLFWPMDGKLAGMGSMPLRNLVICYVLLIFLALKALKVVRTKPVYKIIDGIVIINLIYIATLYIRNPVGTAAFGSQLAGGRPYFDILCAALAYWVIEHMTIGPRLASAFPVLTLAGNFLQGILSFLTFHFPSTAYPISKIYTGISADTFNNPNYDKETIRETYLSPVGSNLTRVLAAYYAPITLLNPIHLLRFLLFAFAIFCIIKSGFRTGVLSAAIFLGLSSYFRKGIAGVIQLGVPALPVLACVIALNGVAFDLPIPAQRALSFLPGDWDHRATESAEGSSDWRFEMWQTVLHSNKYISNWWLGDGFAISQDQLRQAQNAADREGRDGESYRESLMIAGDYHNGPLSSIKFGGYVGFALIMLLILGSGVYGWRLIRKSKGTPFFGCALFFGCYSIFYPLRFLFIFGSYKTEPPEILFYIAMLKLTERSLDAWLSTRQQQAKPEIADRFRPGAAFRN